MEFFEYLPENRPTQPDIPHYSRMDYGNRVGFWRMLDVLNKNNVRACCCLNLELLDHFPEIKDAMVASNWDYMAHGLYNSRPIYDYTEDEERAYWQDFITHLKEMTGKRLKGRLGGGAGYTVRTDDLMAEAGCLYHTSWIIDDQPWPINVRGGQKLIYVPYTGQTNDAGLLAWNREADYFLQMIKDQFDTLYREGAENGRVMCLSLHPHNIGRPNAAKHLDEALRSFSATIPSGTPPRTTSPSITSPTTTTRCRPGSPNGNPENDDALFSSDYTFNPRLERFDYKFL